MINIVVCKGCAERLSNASYAIRHHSAAMDTAIGAARGEAITEEEFEKYREQVRTSFKEAAAAWDTYRQHLVEHGFAV